MNRSDARWNEGEGRSKSGDATGSEERSIELKKLLTGHE